MPKEDPRLEMEALRAELSELRESERRYRGIVEASAHRDDGGLVAASRELVEELNLERARLAEAQSVAKVGSWEIDLRKNVLTWSDESYRIFGIEKDEFGASYEAFLERVHPDDRGTVHRAYQDSVANRVPYAIDHRMVTSDGRLKIVHERCKTFYDEAGPVRSVGTIQDVTEGRLAEAALFDSRQALRAVLDSVPQRVFWKDRDSVYLGCNRPFAVDMGFDDPSDVIGKTDFDATWRARADLYRADDQEVVVSGQPKLNYEERIVYPDGSLGWVRTSKVPLRGRGGEVSGLIGTYEDITERRRLEAQSLHAQRLESVGTLAAGMAHEINNPLTYVISNVEISHEWLESAVDRIRSLAEGGPVPSTLAGLLQSLVEIEEPLLAALDGAERVRRLVLDIKGMVRSEDVLHTPHDLRGAIETAVKMTHHAMRHSAVVRTIFTATPLVEASDGPLVQVITNLLINAAHAIGEGRADANEITVTASTDADGWACVEVRDTGPGIRADLLPHVFDPFFTTKEVGAGMGLGLFRSHSIVAGLGGRLTAESPPDGGALFRLSLPPATRGAVRRPTPIPPPTATRRGKILVIDDEPLVARAIARTLGVPHDVTVLTDGRDALALIASGEVYDLIFCDLMMPNLSGIEVHRSMAAMSSEQASRVVFMTGGAFTAESQEFLDQAGNLHITKPFTTEKIREIAARFVG